MTLALLLFVSLLPWNRFSGTNQGYSIQYRITYDFPADELAGAPHFIIQYHWFDGDKHK